MNFSKSSDILVSQSAEKFFLTSLFNADLHAWFHCTCFWLHYSFNLDLLLSCSHSFPCFPPSDHVNLTTLPFVCTGNSCRLDAAGISWFFCGLSFWRNKTLVSLHILHFKCLDTSGALPGGYWDQIGARTPPYSCLPEPRGIRGHTQSVKVLFTLLQAGHEEGIVYDWPTALCTTANISSIYIYCTEAQHHPVSSKYQHTCCRRSDVFHKHRLGCRKESKRERNSEWRGEERQRISLAEDGKGAGAVIAQHKSQLERQRDLFKESGLTGMSCERCPVYGRLMEVLVSHERQTPDRLRDVQKTRVNRLKIRDESCFSLSRGVMQRRRSQPALHRGQLLPVQTQPGPEMPAGPTRWLI